MIPSMGIQYLLMVTWNWSEIFIHRTIYREIKNQSDYTTVANKYYLWILVAIDRCIGAGLDSLNVCLVLRDGFPKSTLNFIQAMGKCERGTCSKKTGTRNLICFHLLLFLNSFIYLVDRIYKDGVADETLSNNEDNCL